MTIALPKPIADYVAANAHLDPEGMLRPFAPDGVVQDDGGEHRGHAELRTWIQDATIAARAIFTPETHREENGQVVVDGVTSGDFKGSPLRFTLRFTLEGGAIRALEIG
ncbi:MAG TPA: nuclear transport factor 2 family protein [Brevundimonas sp.]|nr:nuclear transport factor 2 family protein [Brevundimonas sp.]